MLDGARVLVAEDEFFIALELAAEIANAGGEVVGPFASVADCLTALETEEIEIALLDANLIDGEVTAVALLLIERGVPMVVHTGVGLPAALRDTGASIPVVMKVDGDISGLIAVMANELAKRGSAPAAFAN